MQVFRHSNEFHRSRSFGIGIMLLFAVITSLVAFGSGIHSASAAAAARAGTQRPGSASSTVHHDLSHPMAVSLPCAGAPRSGIGSNATGDIRVKSHCAYANFPTTCYNNVGYVQTINGAKTWTLTQNNMQAWVELWWCPRYSGDSTGINFSYGRDYPQSGCLTVTVGNQGSYQAGAEMYRTGSLTPYTDGETGTPPYSVCAGSYIWDYSVTGSGSYYYSAVMIAAVPGQYVVTVQSPYQS